jgi:hypothetical protein
MTTHDYATIVYEPLKRRRILLWNAALLLTVCQVADLVTGAWIAWPPRSVLHVLVIMVAVLPIAYGVDLGWSYELTGSQLIARRFGRERKRLALGDLVAIEFVMGLRKVRFAQANIWIMAGPDLRQQTFLAELVHRATHHGVPAPAPVAQVGHDSIRLRVDLLRFPPTCVRCGAASVTHQPLVAQRGFDVLVAVYIQRVAISVPVCAEHRRARRRARWLSWLAPIPMTLLVGAVLMMTQRSAVWSGSLIVATAITLIVARPFYTMRVGQWLDWWTLGIRASKISPDLSELTLRVQNAAVRAAIRRNAGDESA